MIILTFDEYDELLDKADEVLLPDNYTYPSIKEIEDMVNNEENLLDILIAQENSTDKEYCKTINKILTDNLYLTEKKEIKSQDSLEEAQKMNFTFEKIQEMVNIVKGMEFQCSYYYPSVMDLKERDFKPSLLDIYFLLWLTNTEMDLTDDEKVAKNYAQNVLKKLMSIK